MRVLKAIQALVGTSLAAVTTAMAAPLAFLQDPPVKVEVHASETKTVWYTDPVWLAVGGVVVLLIIVLAVFAARGRDGSNTTVVR